MDHSARTSMKSAASCVTQCELQDTLIIGISNAHCGLGSRRGRARLRVVIIEKPPRASRTRRPGSSDGAATAALLGTPSRAHRRDLECTGAKAAVQSRRFAVRASARASTQSQRVCARRACAPVSLRRGANATARRKQKRARALRSARSARPQIGRDYPPNLSISVSGGKETN